MGLKLFLVQGVDTFLRAPWPENMANSLHGFLDKKAKNEAKMAEKCQK